MKEAKDEIKKLTKDRAEAESKLVAVKMKSLAVLNQLDRKEEQLYLSVQWAQKEISEYKLK